MFERFTKEARAAVTEAQDVARETGSRSIDTRHVLVAILARSDEARHGLDAVGADPAAVAALARDDLRAGGLDADALAGLGIDLDAVRREADAVFGPGALDHAGHPPRGHIPFSPDAKKALELALREAIRLQQRTIRGSHLLLGILRADCPGRALLVRAEVEPQALRAALEERLRAA